MRLRKRNQKSKNLHRKVNNHSKCPTDKTSRDISRNPTNREIMITLEEDTAEADINREGETTEEEIRVDSNNIIPKNK